MIQAALKEILEGVLGGLPSPPVSGVIQISLCLEVIGGKIQPKEGSEIPISLDLTLGDGGKPDATEGFDAVFAPIRADDAPF